MEVSKERLVIIGKLIHIHRELRKNETKSAKWTQTEFCKDVCANGTLINIEKGGLSRFVEVYPKLLEKLDLEFGEFPNVDEALDVLINKIHNSLEFSNMEEAVKATEKARRILAKVDSFVYYSDLYYIFDTFYNYISDEVPYSLEFMKYTISMYDLLPANLVLILKSSTFSNAYMYCEDKDFEEITAALHLENKDDIGIRFNLLMKLALDDQSISFLKLYKELEDELIESKNNIRLFDMYSTSIPMISKMEPKTIPDILLKLDDLADQHVVPPMKISIHYYHYAFSLYVEGRYKDAIHYFEKSISFHRRDILPTVIYIADCQRRLKMNIDIPLLDESEVGKYLKLFQELYHYYILEKDTPPFVKQEFLVDKIFPLLRLDEPNIIELVRNEITSLMEVTNQYKAGYVLNSVIEKLKSELK